LNVGDEASNIYIRYTVFFKYLFGEIKLELDQPVWIVAGISMRILQLTAKQAYRIVWERY
jgi:hypothetical protein